MALKKILITKGRRGYYNYFVISSPLIRTRCENWSSSFPAVISCILKLKKSKVTELMTVSLHLSLVLKWKHTCFYPHLFNYHLQALRQSGLLDITMKTADLLRKNQELQREIEDLQRQTKKFVLSVLSNPENGHILENIRSGAQLYEVSRVGLYWVNLWGKCGEILQQAL